MHVRSSDRLTLHELARLLKALADHGYAHPEIGKVKELLDALGREWDVEVTAEQVGQVYGALSLVLPSGTVFAADQGAELDRAIAITSVDRGPDTLSKAMFRAWQNVLAAAKQEPAELVLMETGGLLVPDPRDEDLDGLSIADLFFLVAHDKLDGRALLAAPVLGCGVAAALLAELLFRELICVDLASHQVAATAEPSKQMTRISPPVRQALEEIQDGRPDTLGAWLGVMTAKGHLAVRRHLAETGVVKREQRGRLQKKTYFVPTGEVVDSIFRVVTRPLHVRRMPTAPCAVLVELAKATRLTVARYGEWLHVHDIAPGATLEGVPGRERLDLLLALTRAEVIDLLTRP
jgi:hypothetical protein